MRTGRISLILAIALGAVVCIPPAHANAQQTAQSDDGSQQNPLTRKLSDKERFKQQKELSQELHGTYKKWLDQDVRWIITGQARKAFLSLSNDEERDAFMEQFWRRRSPEPESPANSYRE